MNLFPFKLISTPVSRERNSKALVHLLLFATIITGAALRFAYLDTKAMFWDEPFSYYVASHDIGSIMTGGLDVGHPPLYYILLHYWLQLGNSVFLLRTLSVLLSIPPVLLLYRIAVLLYADSAVGLWSAFIFSIAALPIAYAQYVRFHGPAMSFAMLSIFCFLNILREGRLTYWIGWVISLLAAMYTLELIVLLVVAQAFYLLAYRQDHDWIRARNLLVAHGLVLLSYLPWLFNLISLISSPSSLPASAPGKLSLLASLPGTLFMFTLGKMLPSRANLPVIILGLLTCGGLFIASLLSIRRDGNKTAFLLIWLFVPLVAAIGVSLLKPVYSLSTTRYLLFVAPAYFILLARGLGCLRAGVLRSGVALLVVIVFGAGLAYYYRHDDYYGLKAGASYIKQEYRPGDAIMYQDAAGWSFWYYLSTGLADYDKASPMQDQDLAALIGQGQTRRVWSVSYSTTTAAEMAGQLLGEANAPSSETTRSDDLSRFGSSGAQLTRVSTVTYPGRVTVQVSLYEVSAQP